MVRDFIKFDGAPAAFHAFLDELQAESDRASAVLGAAYLDTLLQTLLEGVMTFTPKLVEPDQLFRGTSPLASFSARIRISYALGLISENVYKDLDRVRDIRNDFSHHVHGLSFETPSIRDRCRHFALLNDLLSYPAVRERFGDMSARQRFDLTCANLAVRLMALASEAQPFRRIAEGYMPLFVEGDGDIPIDLLNPPRRPKDGEGS